MAGFGLVALAELSAVQGVRGILWGRNRYHLSRKPEPTHPKRVTTERVGNPVRMNGERGMSPNQIRRGARFDYDTQRLAWFTRGVSCRRDPCVHRHV